MTFTFKETKTLIDESITEIGRCLISLDSPLFDCLTERGMKKLGIEDKVEFWCQEGFPPVCWDEFTFDKDGSHQESFIILEEDTWKKFQSIL